LLKSAMTVALAVMMAAASAPVAYAQSVTHPTTVALTTQTGQLRASRLIGSTVYDGQNRNIGSVRDVILDRDGRVAAVVVDVGAFLGLGGKYVAVQLSELRTDNDRLTLNRSKEQLLSAETYKLEPPATSR
jgi:sporulation protein YlmC with PRC-barrel domain